MDPAQCRANPNFAGLLRRLAAHHIDSSGLHTRRRDDLEDVLNDYFYGLTSQAKKELRRQKLQFLERDVLVRHLRELLVAERLAESGGRHASEPDRIVGFAMSHLTAKAFASMAQALAGVDATHHLRFQRGAPAEPASNLLGLSPQHIPVMADDDVGCPHLI